MTTPTGTISMADVSAELGLSSPALLNLNNTLVRRLAQKASGAVSFDDLRGRTWKKNFTGIQSVAGCYSAQSGFSVDRYGAGGELTLTLGVWPTDPPNCQTCDWQWLQFGAEVNAARRDANLRPYWLMWRMHPITTQAVGTTVNVRIESWPYTLVAYTYSIERTALNSIRVRLYPTAWGTGDTGTSISIANWWSNTAALMGAPYVYDEAYGYYYAYDPNQHYLTFTWPDLGY